MHQQFSMALILLFIFLASFNVCFYRLVEPTSGKAEDVYNAIMKKCGGERGKDGGMGIDLQKSCAAVAADGASVNFGPQSGVLTRMQQNQMEWLIKIHCVAHRLELAIGDAFKNTYFKNEVHLIFVKTYYHFNQISDMRK